MGRYLLDLNLMRVVGVVAGAYICYATLFFFMQRQFIYPGRTIKVPVRPPVSPAGGELLRIESAAGRVEAWFLPATGGGDGRRKPVVIFFHGNGEVIDFLPEQTEGFRELGCGVLLVEYPGYGRSEGDPTEESLTLTAVAAYDALTGRSDVDGSRVIAFGRSLGCGVATALLRHRPVAALILQSPFTSVRSFASRFLLPKFLVRDVFDNQSAVALFPGPVLILHGTYDDIVPFSQGKEVARGGKNVRFVELACGHNDCPPDWRQFWQIIGDFFRMQRII